MLDALHSALELLVAHPCVRSGHYAAYMVLQTVVLAELVPRSFEDGPAQPEGIHRRVCCCTTKGDAVGTSCTPAAAAALTDAPFGQLEADMPRVGQPAGALAKWCSVGVLLTKHALVTHVSLYASVLH